MDPLTLLGPWIGDDGLTLSFASDAPLVLVDRRDLSTRAVPLGLEEAGLTFLVLEPASPLARSVEGQGEREERLAGAVETLGIGSLRELSVSELLRARDTLDGRSYRLLRHVVTENQRVRDTVRMLHDEGPHGIGDVLFESHRSLRDDVEVSRPELDLAVEISQNYGALGARMVEDGVIVLVPQHLVSHVQVAVDGAFSEHGYAQPEMRTVQPVERPELEA